MYISKALVKAWLLQEKGWQPRHLRHIELPCYRGTSFQAQRRSYSQYSLNSDTNFEPSQQLRGSTCRHEKRNYSGNQRAWRWLRKTLMRTSALLNAGLVDSTRS